MKTNHAILPPLDLNVVNMPDADRERQERYLRKALAEGSGLSPSRKRMMENELRVVEASRKVRQ